MMPQGNWFTVETSSGRKVDIFADKVEFFTTLLVIIGQQLSSGKTKLLLVFTI